MNASKSGAGSIECKERRPCCADLTTCSGSGGMAGGSDNAKMSILLHYLQGLAIQCEVYPQVLRFGCSKDHDFGLGCIQSVSPFVGVCMYFIKHFL